jgi:hypothetical protein
MHLNTRFPVLALACMTITLLAGCDEASDVAEPDAHAQFEAPGAFGLEFDAANADDVPTQLIEEDGMLLIPGSDFTVRIHRTRRVAELNVSRMQLAEWYAQPFRAWSIEASNRLYEVFADDFDFIVFVPASAGQHVALEHDGESVRVRNDIEGLGLPIYDTSGVYGSSGRLQSTILLGGIQHIVEGPSLRELGKRWGNALVPSSHIGYFGFSDVGGQLGGCSPDQITLVDPGIWWCDFNGTQNWSPSGASQNDRPYARLELYLMGLVGPEGVPSITFAKNGEWLDADHGLFTGTLQTVELEHLRAKHGARTPESAAAQKQFRTLFVVVSGGKLIDYWLFHYFDARVAEFAAPEPVLGVPGMLNFYEAASGLASLDAEDLDASLL